MDHSYVYDEKYEVQEPEGCGYPYSRHAKHTARGPNVAHGSF